MPEGAGGLGSHATATHTPRPPRAALLPWPGLDGLSPPRITRAHYVCKYMYLPLAPTRSQQHDMSCRAAPLSHRSQHGTADVRRSSGTAQQGQVCDGRRCWPWPCPRRPLCHPPPSATPRHALPAAAAAAVAPASAAAAAALGKPCGHARRRLTWLRADSPSRPLPDRRPHLPDPPRAPLLRVAAGYAIAPFFDSDRAAVPEPAAPPLRREPGPPARPYRVRLRPHASDVLSIPTTASPRARPPCSSRCSTPKRR